MYIVANYCYVDPTPTTISISDPDLDLSQSLDLSISDLSCWLRFPISRIQESQIHSISRSADPDFSASSRNFILCILDTPSTGGIGQSIVGWLPAAVPAAGHALLIY
jgi:hypothetical protein